MNGQSIRVRWLVSTAFGLIVTAGLIGCGKEGPTLVPVAGTVTVDGAPIAGAGVSFRPDASKGNKAGYNPGGSTDAEGKYELIAAAKPGAPPGWYKVLVFPPSTAPGAEPPKVSPPSYNKKYMDAEATDLSFEVKAGAAPGAYDIKLTK
jgi:hypothetical protein